MVARAETGRPDGPADPVGSALRERLPAFPWTSRSPTRTERRPTASTLGLVDDGRAAGPEPPDARHVRQGGLARLRGHVHRVPIEDVLAELSGPIPRGEAARGAPARRGLPTDPRSVDALSKQLADPATHWGLKQEAATDLGKIGGSSVQPALTKALAASDPRVRRAAALALGNAGEASASEALRRAVEDGPRGRRRRRGRDLARTSARRRAQRST